MDRQLKGPTAEVSDIDLTAYFDRVGYAGPTEPTADTLAALVAAHIRHIPFENLDPLTGVPVIDLSAPALTAKLVARRRGGYCYEHNNLFCDVLRELGYGVERLGGRVVWMNPAGLGGPPGPETHQALAVTVPGEAARYLVDVGFGGQTLTAPIRLVTDDVQQTPHEPSRLSALPRRIRAGGADRAGLATAVHLRPAAAAADRHAGGQLVCVDPSRVGVRRRAQRGTGDRRRPVEPSRPHLAIHRRDGGTERMRFDDAAQVCAALTDRFGIDLAGLGDVEARVAQVLDS